MKKYSAVLLLIQMVSCIAMDRSGTLKVFAKTIGGTIDKEILSITENTWYTPMIGSLVSFHKSLYISNNPDEAQKQLKKVESIMTKEVIDKKIDDTEQFFEAVYNHHWYFAYLVNAVVNDEIQKLHQINGHCPENKSAPEQMSFLRKFIHNRAQQQYEHEDDNDPLILLGVLSIYLFVNMSRLYQ